MRIGLVLSLLFFFSVTSAAQPPATQSAAPVVHPCLTIKPADIARAKENIRRYPWAKTEADALIHLANADVAKFSPEYVAHMLEATTPISYEFTPCPACRDLGKTWHPHGQWKWSPDDPDRITCEVCGTVYPNAKYPESIVLHSKFDPSQTFSFAGGEPMAIFGYKDGRPSLSGCIRARKIGWMTLQCRVLTRAYLISGDVRIAQTLRTILLRLAEVYPHWLVHVAYGEIADIDPHVAAENINSLPSDELVYPPNKPDRALFTGYWSAGRAAGEGQEGWIVSEFALAYDATCEAKDQSGAAIYSADERRHIEKDLLLESTVLLTADKQINNKSAGNRAAALVGMTCGEPSLVHFGLDGFRKTVDDWFLPDGGTPESPAYAMMVFGDTLDFPLAMRGYSDPAGYVDASDHTRIDKIDLFRGDGNGPSAYGKAWAALVDGLQGDLTLPPYADTRVNTKLSPQWADLLVAQYPEKPQYLSLLKALCGDDLHDATAPFAIWYREPGLETKKAPPLVLPDVCLPDLRVGEMRTGADGRESLLLLNASHWGSHHHLDSLGLYYWKDGHELLGDLGYLWDNPLKHQTMRTVAHNTVVIDEQDQRDKERGGEVKFFVTSPHVKAMRASSEAYAQAKRYERTSVLVDHGAGRSYVADFFIVEGGTTRDYVFHGPNQTFAVQQAAPKPTATKLYDFANERSLDGANWRIDWTLDATSTFSAWNVPVDGETDYLADGWGQRDPFNKDRGATLPYIVRRCTGSETTCFMSLFEGHRTNAPFVQSVKRSNAGNRLILQVQTSDGVDTIESESIGIRATSTIANATQWEFTNEH